MPTRSECEIIRQALATIENQIANLRDQVVTARAREQTARAALVQLLEAVAYLVNTDDTVADASATATRILEQLYSDSP